MEKKINSEESKISRNHIEDKRFSDQIDAFLSGNLKVSDVLKVGTTPYAIRICGAGAVPMVVTQTTIRNSIGKGTNEYSNRIRKMHTEPHEISINSIKELARAIRDPILICKGNTQMRSNAKSLIVLCDLKDSFHHNIIVPINLDVRGQHGQINKITSIYGKKSLREWLKKQDIIAMNTEKADELSSNIGIQYPKSATIICFDSTIAYSLKSVKYPNSNNDQFDAAIENALQNPIQDFNRGLGIDV